MKRRTASLRTWSAIHRWSSLVCTLFLFLLCLTGLPLIFHHEIDQALGNDVVIVDPPRPAVASRAPLDRVVETARQRYPGRRPLFASQEVDDDRVWYVTMSSTPESGNLVQAAVDARTGALVGEPAIGGKGVMSVILSLHVDLFAGLPGKLFLGAMGVLLLVSLASGVVLYAPFMQKLAFGTVRSARAVRVRWLDLHNLIGIATVVWLLVVGATGIVNTWAELLQNVWQATEMKAMLAADRVPERPAIVTSGPLQTMLDAAVAQEPAMQVAFVAFPGSSFADDRHFAVFMRGTTPLTSRLHKPVVVDARSLHVTASRDLPWYLTLLLLSQPLHFGDYGGLPLKIIWAAFDAAALLVSGSGLYLWFARRARATASSRPTVGKPLRSAA